MENENNRNQSAGRILLISSASIILAFMIYYAVMVMIGTGKKLDELRGKYKSVARKGVNEQVYSDSTYLATLKEKAFIQAKLAMAQTDSIYLALNLSDSTANVEISGVTVFLAKIKKIEMSGILRKCDADVLYNMLSSPMNIENSFATIPKEPVMIKTAPKDTSEYEPDIMPDTSLIEPVNYMLEMKSGLRLYVYQDEKGTPIERRSQFRFDFHDHLNTAIRNLRSVVKFKVPEYYPYIRIWVPRDDGKIIYRALPRRGQVAVYT